MNVKKTIIMAVIAAIAVAAFWFDQKKTAEKVAIKEAESRVVTAKKDEITELTVRQDGKTTQTTQLVKKGEDWELTQPIKARADQSAVSSLLDEIDRARRTDPFDPAGRKLDEFGLAQPEVKLEVKAAAANYVQELELGGKTTTGSDVYARAAKDPRIFTVSDSLFNQLIKPVNDLRYKNALPAPLDEATSAVLTYEGKKVALRKNGADWYLTEPIRDAADNDKVRDLLSTLGRVAANDFIDTHPLNMASMGLDKPVASGLFTAPVKEKPTQMTLLVGKDVPGKDGQVYAMNPGASYAFTIAKDDAAKLNPTMDDLRSKELFDIKMGEAGRVILDSGGKQVDLSADTAGTWSFTKDPAVKLDQAAVNQTVAALTGLRATRFIDDPSSLTNTGLDKPFLRLTAVSKDGKTTRTVLTGRNSSAEDFVYAKVDGGTQVVGIAPDEPKKFFVTPDQYLDKALFNFDEALVKRVQIRDGGKTVQFVAQPGGAWTAKPEGSGKEFQVDAAKMSALIYSVTSLQWNRRYDMNIPADAEVIKNHKLEQPERTIVLQDEAGKDLASLAQGAQQETDEMTYVRRGAQDYYGINKAVYNSVKTSMDSVLEGVAEKK